MRSPKMSDLNSDSSVVMNEKGEPRPIDQPSAMSVASPVASWWMANDALMPAPLTSLPCSYSLRTDGPMPLGATSTTLMSSRKVAPSACITPSRKPCDRPSVAPGFMALSRSG